MIRFAEREGPITKIGLGLLDAPHHFESSDIRTIRESALEALSREELEGYTSWTIRKENINGKVFKPVIGLGLFTQLPYNILKVHAFEPTEYSVPDYWEAIPKLESTGEMRSIDTNSRRCEVRMPLPITVLILF